MPINCKYLSAIDLPYRYLLTTGYKETSLRAVFPCFDQSEFKSTFKFTIFYNPEFSLITNAGEVLTEGPL